MTPASMFSQSFLLTTIALLAMVNYAANAQADAPQAEVVLEGGETPDTLSVKTDDMRTSIRIASKLVAGAVGGNLSFFGLTQMLASGCDRDDGICGAVVYTIGMSTFYPVGTALGVSLVDPRPQFAASLIGSMLGIGVGFGLAEKYDNIWISPLFVCPSIFATIMSELSRFDQPSVFMSHNSPEVSRFSVGLMPGPKGSLSAVATLRF